MNNNNRNAHAPHDDSAHKLLTDNRNRYLWQSVLGLPRPPMLTDLIALAKEVRHATVL